MDFESLLELDSLYASLNAAIEGPPEAVAALSAMRTNLGRFREQTSVNALYHLMREDAQTIDTDTRDTVKIYPSSKKKIRVE